jgi:uncharacterized YccA/Bax inhibitor family protein
MSTILLPFSRLLIVSNFSSLRIVFGQVCTQIALGDVDLCFSVILVAKAGAVEGGENYVSCVIMSPTYSVDTHDRLHDNDVIFC